MQPLSSSISLPAKDVHPKAFYEKLNFKVSGADLNRNHVVMQKETHKKGLGQAIFEPRAEQVQDLLRPSRRITWQDDGLVSQRRL